MLGLSAIAELPLGDTRRVTFKYTMSVTHGTYALSLHGAAKLISDIYPSGEYILSGSDVVLRFAHAYTFAVDSGSYALTMQDFTIRGFLSPFVDATVYTEQVVPSEIWTEQVPPIDVWVEQIGASGAWIEQAAPSDSWAGQSVAASLWVEQTQATGTWTEQAEPSDIWVEQTNISSPTYAEASDVSNNAWTEAA